MIFVPHFIGDPNGSRCIVEYFICVVIMAENMAAFELLEFWSGQAEVWLLQVETQFALCGITNGSTEHQHDVVVLNHTFADITASRDRLGPPASLSGLGDSKVSELMHFLGGPPPCFLFNTVATMVGN